MSIIWTDVHWDRAATDDLVRQLLATAGAVGDVIAVLGGDGPVDDQSWSGPHRHVYDGERRDLVAGARRLADALVAAAGRTAALAEVAAGEERLRARLRSQSMAESACVPGEPC